MSTRGYLILGVLLLALIAYLAWPQGDGGPSTYDLLEQRPPGGFVLTGGGLEQVVRGEQVTINGIERPLDQELVERLWGGLERMASVHEPVAPSGDLAAYGLGADATRLAAQGLELRWGIKDGTGWLFHAGERRLYRFDPRLIASLDAASGRLDQRALIAVDGGSLDAVVAHPEGAALRLEPERGGGGEIRAWRYADDADRPEATGRIRRLLDWFSVRQLDDLSGALPEETEPTLRIDLVRADDVRRLELRRDGDGAWLAVPGLPPQAIAPQQADALEALVADLTSDRLFDLPIQAAASPVGAIVVTRGDEELFRVERGDLGDTNPEGASTWELSWAGGREVASADVGMRFLDAVVGLPVTDVRARQAALAAPPPAGEGVETLRLSGYMPGGGLWLQLDGDRVATATHTARLAEGRPPLLRDLGPGSALSRELLRMPPERVGKLQRVRFGPDGVRAEVLHRTGSGWSLIEVVGDPAAPTRRPATPVSEAAVRRLVGALILARADAVRLATPADLAIRENPQRRELAVRIEPLDIEKATDIDRVEETAAREWGLALQPAADGGWEAVDFDGIQHYRLGDELVAEWFGELSTGAVLAIQPSRVTRVAVTPPTGRAYDLVKDDEAWWVELPAGGRYAADATSLRAYLGALARLEATAMDPNGLPLAPDGEGHGVIELQLPGFDGRPQELQLVVAPPTAGVVSASTGSGRLGLDPADVPGLFPVVGTFLSPADLQRLDADAGG